MTADVDSRAKLSYPGPTFGPPSTGVGEAADARTNPKFRKSDCDGRGGARVIGVRAVIEMLAVTSVIGMRGVTGVIEMRGVTGVTGGIGVRGVIGLRGVIRERGVSGVAA